MNIVCVESLGISREYFEGLKARYVSLGHDFTYYMDRREDEETLAERMKEADVAIMGQLFGIRGGYNGFWMVWTPNFVIGFFGIILYLRLKRK